MKFLRLHRLRIIAGAFVVLMLLLKARAVLNRAEPFDFVDDRPRTVLRVVDGDTLLLADGHRVRLLGVNTPETRHPARPAEPWGVEATEFTRRFVEGRTLSLRFDRERLDRYDRFLAFAYAEGEFLNEELIRAGMSRAETRFPYSEAMKRRFRAAEEEAREAKRGIWSDSASSVASTRGGDGTKGAESGAKSRSGD